jgi:hypothetical protein
MKAQAHETAQLGELVAIAFDNAARYSSDAREVSRLATQAVTRMLRHARRVSTPTEKKAALAARISDAAGWFGGW